MRRFVDLVFVGSIAVATSSCQEEQQPPEQHGWPDAGQSLAKVDAGSAVAGDASGPVTCAMLDSLSCEQNPDCRPLIGLAYDPVRYCRAANETVLGCHDYVGCGGSSTRAVDPSGNSWRLRNVCLPPGFQAVPEAPQPAEWIDDYPVCSSGAVQAMCSTLDEASCSANEACTALMGQRINSLRRCKEASTMFAVCAQNTGCNSRPIYAKNPTTNVTWELERDCLPLGFTALTEDAAEATAAWPTCTF